MVASGIGSLTLINDVTHAGGRRMTLKARLKNVIKENVDRFNTIKGAFHLFKRRLKEETPKQALTERS